MVNFTFKRNKKIRKKKYFSSIRLFFQSVGWILIEFITFFLFFPLYFIFHFFLHLNWVSFRGVCHNQVSDACVGSAVSCKCFFLHLLNHLIDVKVKLCIMLHKVYKKTKLINEFTGFFLMKENINFFSYVCYGKRVKSLELSWPWKKLIWLKI